MKNHKIKTMTNIHTYIYRRAHRMSLWYKTLRCLGAITPMNYVAIKFKECKKWQHFRINHRCKNEMNLDHTVFFLFLFFRHTMSMSIQWLFFWVLCFHLWYFNSPTFSVGPTFKPLQLYHFMVVVIRNETLTYCIVMAKCITDQDHTILHINNNICGAALF